MVAVQVLQDVISLFTRHHDSDSPHKAVSFHCQLMLSVPKWFHHIANFLSRPARPSIANDLAQDLIFPGC